MREGRPLRVLVVDDDADHRFLMSRKLRDTGHEATAIGDPSAVGDHLATVDVVLLDYRIPGTSGIEVLTSIVAASGPPVIMVTGMGSEAIAVEALQAGATDYVVKSDGYLDELPRLVETAWRRRDIDERSAALEDLAVLVTGAADRQQVIDGITEGARGLLGVDDVELVLEEIPRPDPAARTEVTGDRVVVPLLDSQRNRVGSMVVATSGHVISPEVIGLAESFASFAAVGLANAEAMEAERGAVGELQDTLDMRRQLVAAVGHELRTPLTSIAGFSSTLLRHWDQFGDQERRELVERIERNSADLSDIVTRLMDYAYMDSGRMEVRAERTDLRLTVEEICSSLDVRGRGEVAIDLPDVVVTADPTLLRRVVINLVTNAFKYAGNHPEVRITAAAAGSHAAVAVADNGPGIAPEDLGQVFEAFYRSGRDKRKRQGTGLGLALVNDYVRLMGGEVSVSSPPGQGATFTFTLPLAGAG